MEHVVEFALPSELMWPPYAQFSIKLEVIIFTLNFRTIICKNRILTLNRQLRNISKILNPIFFPLSSYISLVFSKLVKMFQLPSRTVTLTFLHNFICKQLLTKLHISHGNFGFFYPQFQPLPCQLNELILNKLLPSKLPSKLATLKCPYMQF